MQPELRTAVLRIRDTQCPRASVSDLEHSWYFRLDWLRELSGPGTWLGGVRYSWFLLERWGLAYQVQSRHGDRRPEARNWVKVCPVGAPRGSPHFIPQGRDQGHRELWGLLPGGNYWKTVAKPHVSHRHSGELLTPLCERGEVPSPVRAALYIASVFDEGESCWGQETVLTMTHPRPHLRTGPQCSHPYSGHTRLNDLLSSGSKPPPGAS